MAKTSKTNAVRILEQLNIEYELHTYDIDIEDFNAVAVADLIGLESEVVYKTLVVHGDKTGPCFAVVASDCELDLKLLAKARGDRRVSMMAVRAVEPLTGYRRGGVTAVGSRKRLPVVLDAAAADLEHIAVSAGTKGVQMVVRTKDFVAATSADVVAITRRRDTG